MSLMLSNYCFEINNLIFVGLAFVYAVCVLMRVHVCVYMCTCLQWLEGILGYEGIHHTFLGSAWVGGGRLFIWVKVSRWSSAYQLGQVGQPGSSGELSACLPHLPSVDTTSTCHQAQAIITLPLNLCFVDED